MIKIRNLRKDYNKTTVLQDVSFDMECGEHCIIRGASGSGKSTFLHLLGGLERPTSGEIIFDGTNISQLDDSGLANFRNNYVGFVFQFHFLLPSMNCLENIFLPARIGGHYSKNLVEHVYHLAKVLRVDDLLHKYPYHISGGEQQRINIIRAVSMRPRLLLCDEPTGNLDSANSEIVTNLLKTLATESGSMLIIVTHDNKTASHFSRVDTLEDGIFVN